MTVLVRSRDFVQSSTVRLEVTRRAELAVRAMTALAGAPGRVKAPSLAESLGTTPAFVAQVMGPLVRAGWVRSDPGPTGGYALSASLDDVSVLAVIEAVDGATDAGKCVVADRACDADDACVLHDAWTRARGELMHSLGGTSLASLSAAADFGS